MWNETTAPRSGTASETSSEPANADSTTQSELGPEVDPEIRAPAVRPVERDPVAERLQDVRVEALAELIVSDGDCEVVDLHGAQNSTTVLFCQVGCHRQRLEAEVE